MNIIKSIVFENYINLLDYLKLCDAKIMWRSKNRHNGTKIINIFNPSIVTVGNMSYGPLEIYSWGVENEKLIIGNYVSIAEGVKFILSGIHNYKCFSTFPFKSKYKIGYEDIGSKGPIIIGDDVWIGLNALVLSGVTISKGAVVGAGSVISKDIPPFAIVTGNPAHIQKYRFTEDIIEYLIGLDYSKYLNNHFIKNNINKLYKEVNLNMLKDLFEKSGLV
jgi:acetyltransferase-like isoleucine patch superfamily enzyme